MSMSIPDCRRGGFALPVAVFALVVVGVLVTGGFYMARQETRIGVASQNASIAFYVAEQGMNEELANWNAAQYADIPLWGDTTVVDSVGTWGVARVTITHMSDYMYYVESEGEVTQGGQLAGATRQVGAVVKIRTADIDPPAALTTRGKTEIKGSAEVHGEDVYPTGWTGLCTDPLDNKPGIMTNNDNQVTGSAITGTPPIAEDTTLNDSTFLDYGDTDWDDLISLGKEVTSLGATVNQTLPDTTVTPRACRTSTLTNWGDPTSPNGACGDYFPIIYHAGPILRIQSGGIGQGILLVNGTLDLRGNFVFYGIIIVQGSFETQGSGNRVYGAVMASNAQFDAQSLVGGSVVTNSTCAVDRAIKNNADLAKARPIFQRGWVDVSNVQPVL